MKRARKLPAWKQLSILFSRNAEIMNNNKKKLVFSLGLPMISAVIISLVIKKDMFQLYEATKSGMFCIVCAIIFIGLFNSIQEVCNERSILKREMMRGLNLTSYILAKMLFQLILCMVQTMIFAICVSIIIKVPEKGTVSAFFFLDMTVSLFLLEYAADGMGILISSIVRRGDFANVIAPIIIIFQIVFSGVLFEMKGVAKQFANFMISKWGMEAMGSICKLNTLTLKMQEEMPKMADQIVHKKETMYTASARHVEQTWIVLALFVIASVIISRICLARVAKDRR